MEVTLVRTVRRTLLLALALITAPSVSPAFAQDERVWIDVNFGLATSAAGDEAFAFEGRLFSEPAAFAVAYPEPSRGAAFDFGGGYMFTPRVGVGLSFTGTAHQDPAGLGATIPHPYFFNASATASGTTDSELMRTEGGANIQLMVVPMHSRKLRVRLFGGPTFFRYTADMVSDLSYRQTALPISRTNLVTITDFEAVEVEGTGWGVHVGGDVTYFFSRVFGLGGFARLTRGTVTIDEPMSEDEADVTVGGVQFGGGVRFRF
jgi:hypothetical protein